MKEDSDISYLSQTRIVSLIDILGTHDAIGSKKGFLILDEDYEALKSIEVNLCSLNWI